MSLVLVTLKSRKKSTAVNHSALLCFSALCVCIFYVVLCSCLFSPTTEFCYQFYIYLSKLRPLFSKLRSYNIGEMFLFFFRFDQYHKGLSSSILKRTSKF